MTRFRLSNARARQFFAAKHGLANTPTGPCPQARLEETISTLGLVQLDSINTVERAHHMILRARLGQYKTAQLHRALAKNRSVFEHWTHDASVLPIQQYPYWRLKFEREEKYIAERWKTWRRPGFEEKLDDVLKHISDHGPCSSSDVGNEEKKTSGGWWDWHPSKTALEYLWMSGRLAVTRRVGFRKVYDLTENVIPPVHLNKRLSDDEILDWSCRSALEKLGFATSGELAAFYRIASPAEAKNWCEDKVSAGLIVEVEIVGHSGKISKSFAFPDQFEEALHELPSFSPRVRILSPFDPMLRDRKRAARLFGFDYRIEIFVPEAKRKYGYYVFPVMQADKMIGRIDMKCFRPENRMEVRAFWPEKGLRQSNTRHKSLVREIERLSGFAGAQTIDYQEGWQWAKHPTSVS